MKFLHKRREIRLDRIRIMNETRTRQEVPSKFQRWRYARALASVRERNMRDEFRRIPDLPKVDPLHWNDNPKTRFVHQVVDELTDLYQTYPRTLRFYRIMRFSSIVIGASVPVASVTTSAIPWVVTLLSSAVVAIEGIIQLGRYQQIGYSQMRLYGQLRRELERFIGGIGVYSTETTALPIFVERVSQIKDDSDASLVDLLTKTEKEGGGSPGQQPS